MALVDEGFTTYAVRGEGSLSDVEYLVIHFFVMCNEEASVAAVKSVTYEEGLIVSVKKNWRLGGVTS